MHGPPRTFPPTAPLEYLADLKVRFLGNDGLTFVWSCCTGQPSYLIITLERPPHHRMVLASFEEIGPKDMTVLPPVRLK